MATINKDQEQKVKKLEETVIPIKRKSKEMEALLEAAYGMTVEEARTIIEERSKNPLSHSYEALQKAKAMIAAYETEPTVSSPRDGWKRSD